MGSVVSSSSWRYAPARPETKTKAEPSFLESLFAPPKKKEEEVKLEDIALIVGALALLVLILETKHNTKIDAVSGAAPLPGMRKANR